MTVFSRFQKCLVTGIVVTGGVIFLHYGSNYQKAYASWTNDSTPVVKWDFNWDRRNSGCLKKQDKNGDVNPANDNAYNEKLEKQKTKAVRNIILIRHGQYNLNGRTDEDCVLTELGRSQAKLTGIRLHDLNFPYNKIIRSTMTRARETAEYIAESLPKNIVVIDDPLLEEGSPILPEPPVSYWKPGDHYTFQDGPRIEAAFRKYFHRANPDQEKDSYEIIVCHGNVIRYFVCRALQLPAEAWLRFSILHGSITWISIYNNGMVLLRLYTDAGHMPPESLTTM